MRSQLIVTFGDFFFEKEIRSLSSSVTGAVLALLNLWIERWEGHTQGENNGARCVRLADGAGFGSLLE